MNKWFIYLSLIIGYALNLLPWKKFFGCVPDLLTLILLFWNIYQPYKVNIGTAFVIGIIVDVHEVCLLGEHGLTNTLLAFSIMSLTRQLLYLPTFLQIFYIFPLFIASKLILISIHMINKLPFLGWHFLIDCLISAILWPLINILLMLFQKYISKYNK